MYGWLAVSDSVWSGQVSITATRRPRRAPNTMHRVRRSEPSALRQARLAVTPHATALYVNDAGALTEITSAGAPLRGSPPACWGGDGSGGGGAAFAIDDALPPLPLCTQAGWTETWGAMHRRLSNGTHVALACRCGSAPALQSWLCQHIMPCSC